MSATLETNLRAAQFDAMRQVQGLPAELKLYSTSPESGYRAPITISAGWTAAREKDTLDGTQFYAVRIAETDANLAILTEAVVRKLSAIGIGNLRHIKKDLIYPFENPRVWIIHAEPMGEKIS